MSIKRRLEHAEQKFNENKPVQLSPEARKMRAIDEEMRRLEREIAEERAKMSPEEIRHADADDKAILAALSGLSPDEAIAFLEAEIAATEAEGEGVPS